MLNNKRVFISGGNGVIGNELVKKLHAEGATLFVGDLKPRPSDWPSDITYRHGDLNYITKEELVDFAPEIFFHLAATFERSAETYEFWEENFAHNVNLSHHLISVLKDAESLRSVVFASSYLIYSKELYSFDRPVDQPKSLKESEQIRPRNLTGCAKLSHEIELEFIKQYRKIQIINARIYRSYGRNSRDIISRWVRSLLKGETITVFNEDNIFDYVFAEDVAEGLLLLSKTDFSGVVNIGTGKSRKIKDVIDVLQKQFPGLKKDQVSQQIPFEASQADTSLLQTLTGWVPRHRIEDAIPKIIEYEKGAGHSQGGSETNVMVTSISKKVAMIKAINKGMKKIGCRGKLYGADSDPACTGRYFVDDFWQMPATLDENLSAILSYCKTNNIRIIFPSRDGELEFWSKHSGELGRIGTRVMVSSQETVHNCIDKLSFYRECRKNGLAAIQTAIDIAEINSMRYVAKERFGAGSKSIGLNLTKQEALDWATQISLPVFQPFIEGVEYSIDAYAAKNGVVKGVVVRERNSIVNGESQITTTVKNQILEDMGADVACALKLVGHFVLQVIVDINGNAHIIECNSRFGGASTLAVSAGLDSFYWFLLECEGSDLHQIPFKRSPNELRQVRYAENHIVVV